jgi:hypothetical protein
MARPNQILSGFRALSLAVSQSGGLDVWRSGGGILSEHGWMARLKSGPLSWGDATEARSLIVEGRRSTVEGRCSVVQR